MLKTHRVTNLRASTQRCACWIRGNWTSTKQDVLEAWLYPATFDFLPAVSNLGSLRRFTLKVWIYTREKLPQKHPKGIWTLFSQNSLMFFCDPWLVSLPGSLVQRRVVFLFPLTLPFPFHVPFPSFSCFKIDYGLQMGGSETGLKPVWTSKATVRTASLWLYS